jgi:hypothetical protein
VISEVGHPENGPIAIYQRFAKHTREAHLGTLLASPFFSPARVATTIRRRERSTGA